MDSNSLSFSEDITSLGCNNIINPTAASDQKSKDRFKFVIRLRFFEIIFKIADYCLPRTIHNMATKSMMDKGVSAQIIYIRSGIIDITKTIFCLSG